ncbi:MAG TPA: hypothetical protein PLC52_02395 [Anaerolineales bacterium]|nr:hypothetical protein [Anaerolineales bacterium]HRQ91703.1 hypothetical protein [Anaerolineales bacterium]
MSASEHVAYKTKQQQQALEQLQANPRVELVRVAGPEECSTVQTVQGVYSKFEVPVLPVEGCSREGGCICHYEPVLNEIYP